MESGSGAWPSVGFEIRQWDPAVDVRDSFSPIRAGSGPYRAVLPAAIADLPFDLPPELMAHAADATAEAIRLDAEFGYRDRAAPSLLTHAESMASSAIERVSTSALATALAEFDESRDPNGRQIVSHVRSIGLARDKAGALDEDAIVQVQRTLLASSRPERRGRWRDQQVWIGGGAHGPNRASFIPPHVSRLPSAMDDLIRFIRRPQLPALAQAAIAHAQYETIHPFLEANGRTGRSLVQGMLRRADICRALPLPISAGFLQDTIGYFDALTKYRSGQIDPIIGIFATSAILAAEASRQLIDDVSAVRASWYQRCTARHGSGALRLISFLELTPVVTSATAQLHLGVSAPNAQLAIDRLVSDGILVQVAGLQRNRVWAAVELCSTLDAFAERTRRQR